VAGDEQNLYRNYGSNYDGSYSSEDCDTAAERNSSPGKSVCGWIRNESSALGQLSYNGR